MFVDEGRAFLSEFMLNLLRSAAAAAAAAAVAAQWFSSSSQNLAYAASSIKSSSWLGSLTDIWDRARIF